MLGLSALVESAKAAHARGMATQRETSPTSAGQATRSDDERPLDESELEIDDEAPLDAPIDAPIEDALDQRHVELLDDDEHEVS
jgi:hypothetical protein